MCDPETITCPEFKSDPEQYGQYTNTTWSLAAGAMCDVNIDATNGVARVIFDESSFLGIEGDYKIGDVITFDSGENTITIYNGGETGPLTFLISFSGATTLAAAAMGSMAVLTGLF